jgi:hypothetical protein
MKMVICKVISKGMIFDTEVDYFYQDSLPDELKNPNIHIFPETMQPRKLMRRSKEGNTKNIVKNFSNIEIKKHEKLF